MRRVLIAIGAVLGMTPTAAQALPEWAAAGEVAPGRQFAAVLSGGVVHVVSERYIQLDATGTVLVDESDAGDERQGPLDFYPAIAVGPDAAVHVVTRHGGSFEAGHEIRYQRRAPGGGWGQQVSVGTPVARNYVVGVAAPSGGRVLVTHGRQVADVSSQMDLYEVADGVATLVGATPQGWLRTDNDYRIESAGAGVVLASGSPGPVDPVHVAFAADASGDVLAQWQSTHTTHEGGAGRRGGPSAFVDSTGAVHVAYGAESSLHYAGYSAAGMLVAPDVQALGGLGTWHLSYGNGVVVASADGSQVVVVAGQNLDGDATASGAELMWAESSDGGATFSPAQSTGLVTDGGEGRMRPRLLHVDDTLMLLYFDPSANAIALATSAWAVDDPGPGATTGGAGDDAGDAGADEASGGDGTEGDAASSSGDGGASTTGSSLSAGGATGQPGAFPWGDADEGGCSCDAGPGCPQWLAGALTLLALGLGRRRTAHAAAQAQSAEPT